MAEECSTSCVRVEFEEEMRQALEVRRALYTETIGPALMSIDAAAAEETNLDPLTGIEIATHSNEARAAGVRMGDTLDGMEATINQLFTPESGADRETMCRECPGAIIQAGRILCGSTVLTEAERHAVIKNMADNDSSSEA